MREYERESLRVLLEAEGISDRRVLEAFLSVPRHEFVPEAYQSQAYDDNALPLGHGQTISQPYIVALMTSALRLTGDERVLEIGTGSGYQAAILSRLAAHVTTIERIPELSQTAQATLGRLGYENIDFVVGDGTLGCPEQAPFDGIIVTAGGPTIPSSLFEQLADGGRLVMPVGDELTQQLQCLTRSGGRTEAETLCGCRFVPLIGSEGWPMAE